MGLVDTVECDAVDGARPAPWVARQLAPNPFASLSTMRSSETTDLAIEQTVTSRMSDISASCLT